MKKLFCLILAVLLCLASCGKEVPVAETEIVEPEIEQETEPEIEIEADPVPVPEPAPETESEPVPVPDPEPEIESVPEPPVIKPNYYNGPKVQPKLKSEHQYLFDAYDKSVDGIAGYFEVLDLGGKRYVLATLKDHWYGELLYVNESGDEIVFEETAAGGFIDRLDVEYVEMSQGNFIAAICTTHVGNGDLRLIPIDEDTKTSYEIPASRAMFGNEWLEQFNYLFEHGSDCTDFYGGHMTPNYRDVDGDGNTDIVLTGVQFVRNRARTGIVAEYDCEYVYIYDVDEDEFILDVSRSRHDELR